MIRATVVLEAEADDERLQSRLKPLRGTNHQVILVCEHDERDVVRGVAAQMLSNAVVREFDEIVGPILNRLLPEIHGDFIAFLPVETDPTAPLMDGLSDNGLRILVNPMDFPTTNMQAHNRFARGFCAGADLLKIPAASNHLDAWDPLALIAANAAVGRRISYSASRVERKTDVMPAPRHPPVLTRDARVCVMIPHYRCEPWLAETLTSMVNQTRTPDAVVVIDDGSEDPPRDIVNSFPDVSLYRATQNSGPYRLMQQVIIQTRFDAYMFQDADDWSAKERLGLLLAEAERRGAEQVGGGELRCLLGRHSPIPKRYAPHGAVLPHAYPLDVNAALDIKPGYPLLFGTSLFSRGLWERVGGFATGLRFGNDTEFLHRVGHAARITNVPDGLYFRRMRDDSLTVNPNTGLASQARMDQRRELNVREQTRREVLKAGGRPDLSPLTVAPPIRLEHLIGPKILSE